MTAPHVGRYGDLMERLLGLDTGDALPIVPPALQAFIDVARLDDASLPYLRSERLCQGGSAAAAPGAGNFNRSSCYNPAGSNLLMIVTMAKAWTDTAGDIYAVIQNVNPAGTLGWAMCTDPRGSNQKPVGTVNFSQTAIAVSSVGLFYRKTFSASTESPVDLGQSGIVLPPGWMLQLQHATAVTPILYANYAWRERAFYSYEQ